MKVFIPITDEMLDKGLIPDDLAAYQPGLLLLSHLQAAPLQSRSSTNRSPTATPKPEATPALSSSTNMACAALG